MHSRHRQFSRGVLTASTQRDFAQSGLWRNYRAAGFAYTPPSKGVAEHDWYSPNSGRAGPDVLCGWLPHCKDFVGVAFWSGAERSLLGGGVHDRV